MTYWNLSWDISYMIEKENNMIRYKSSLIGQFRLEQVELWLNVIRAHCFQYVRKLSWCGGSTHKFIELVQWEASNVEMIWVVGTPN